MFQFDYLTTLLGCQFCQHLISLSNPTKPLRLDEMCKQEKPNKFHQQVFVCLFEWTPSQWKEVGIPLGILPDRTNVPTFLGRVNPNTTAARNRTQRLARHQAATRTQADFNKTNQQDIKNRL